MIEDMGTTKRGGLSTRRKLKIWERESGKCAICSAKLMAGQFIYEHMRALELGGTDTDENIRLTCLTCAKEKTKKDHQITAKAKSQKSSYLTYSGKTAYFISLLPVLLASIGYSNHLSLSE